MQSCRQLIGLCLLTCVSGKLVKLAKLYGVDLSLAAQFWQLTAWRLLTRNCCCINNRSTSDPGEPVMRCGIDLLAGEYP